MKKHNAIEVNLAVISLNLQTMLNLKSRSFLFAQESQWIYRMIVFAIARLDTVDAKALNRR
jgi:hypothetical protein